MKSLLKTGMFLGLIMTLGCSTELEEVLIIEEALNVEESIIEVQEEAGPRAVVPGEFIITYTDDETSQSLKTSYALSKGRLESLEKSFTNKAQEVLKTNTLDIGTLEKVYYGAVNGFKLTNVDANALAELKKDKRIASIEPNYIINANFPKPMVQGGIKASQLSSLGLFETQAGPPIPVENLELKNGEFVPWGVRWVGRRNGRIVKAKVYVIDSGIAPHEDLNIFKGQSRSFIPGEDWVDTNGHGTHVAGIIGAKKNRKGIVGVCFNVRLVAIRVIGSDGTGSLDQTISGFNYVYNRANPSDVFNYSVGPRVRFTSVAMDNAIKRLSSKIVGAIAAGNANDDTAYFSPQRLIDSRSWIVGALDNNIQPANYSNFGESVDRWAPGSSIISTWLNGGYQIISGTSMASPHVAGILVNRGNNTVRIRGSATKGQHTAPVARM